MEYLIGVDSERLDRFDLGNIEKYKRKLLSSKEVEFLDSVIDSRKQRFIASRFSSKEAIFKAIGIGISNIKFSDITILPNSEGKPIVDLEGYDIELSITYTDVYVTTFVILKKL